MPVIYYVDAALQTINNVRAVVVGFWTSESLVRKSLLMYTFLNFIPVNQKVRLGLLPYRPPV